MAQRAGLAADRGIGEGGAPVEALIAGDADEKVDLVVHGVCALEQAVCIFEIGRGEMADDLKCAQIITVGVDAADGRHGVERMHAASFRGKSVLHWNT
jgi:hypothetical protein